VHKAEPRLMKVLRLSFASTGCATLRKLYLIFFSFAKGTTGDWNLAQTA
jgi:hypothetical protein